MPHIRFENNVLDASQRPTHHPADPQTSNTGGAKHRRKSKKPEKHQKPILPAYTNPTVTPQTMFVEENQQNIQNGPATTSQGMCQTPYHYPMIGSDDPSAIINSQALILRLPGVAEIIYNLGRQTVIGQRNKPVCSLILLISGTEVIPYGFQSSSEYPNIANNVARNEYERTLQASGLRILPEHQRLGMVLSLLQTI